MDHSYWMPQPDVQRLVHFKGRLLDRVLDPPGLLILTTEKKPLVIPSMRRAEKPKVVAWKELSSVAIGVTSRGSHCQGAQGKNFEMTYLGDRIHERRKCLVQIRTFKTISSNYEINLSFFLSTHPSIHESSHSLCKV